VILRLAVFTQYQSVTDTHTETDGQIHDDGMYCWNFAMNFGVRKLESWGYHAALFA